MANILLLDVLDGPSNIATPHQFLMKGGFAASLVVFSQVAVRCSLEVDPILVYLYYLHQDPVFPEVVRHTPLDLVISLSVRVGLEYS